MLIWKSSVPLKVKIFMWMSLYDRIQCGVQLKKKQWSGPEKCLICDVHETTDHILFHCPLAIFLWSFLRDCLGWPISPTSCSSLFIEIIERQRGKKQEVTLYLCAGVLWSIWKTRNDMVFNKRVMSSPVNLVYKMLMLTKAWRPLLKPKFKPVAEDMINLLSANASSAM